MEIKCYKCGVMSSKYMSKEKFIDYVNTKGENEVYCPYCFGKFENGNPENGFEYLVSEFDPESICVNKHIMMTTTNSFEGYKVLKQFGVVSSRIVLGVGMITEIKSSFTDLVGGRSTSYERQLEQLEKNAVANLERKVIKLNANSIAGYRFDVDEISGKGSQMLMISVSGTALLIKEDRSFEKALEINQV